ncbi:uncharacterized protein LOC111153523 [Enhydra lutris kenyoni]|uniref:Uncharacterized protein LOC111153523 n=1 Tax=Enhydra lutris kenyoni TaxID=391180 RepID=A0A2Y9KFW4_ENHLU|nr:uncharacterized protein LOC111153523 [Enhydra lutris kenyoni]
MGLGEGTREAQKSAAAFRLEPYRTCAIRLRSQKGPEHRLPSTLPPAQGEQSASAETSGVPQDAEPPSPSPGGGAGDAQETYLTRAAFGRLCCRDQLRHSRQVIWMELLPPGAGRSVRASGGRGRRVGGAGAGRGAARGAGRCRAGAAGPNSPGTRLRGGARLRVCNARAPRQVCVCVCVCVSPLSPSFPAGPPARWSGERQPESPSRRSAPLPSSASARRARGGGDRGPRSSGAPGLGRGFRRPARLSRSEAQGEQCARRLPKLGEAAGPARRPPRLFPFSLHPLAPVPHALQRSQAGLQQRRRDFPPQPDWAPESVPRDAGLCPAAACLARGAGLGRVPRSGRFLLGSRVSRGLPGGSEVLQPR